MFGIGFYELLIIILLVVFLTKPEDIPSVIKSFAKFVKKIREFFSIWNKKINDITSDIDEVKNETELSFHDQVAQIRLSFEDKSETTKKTPPKRKSK